MPLGPTAVGVAYFTGIKLAGYSAAGVAINRAAGPPDPNPLAFGAARTIVGVVAGVGYALVLNSVISTAPFADFANGFPILFYVGLIPIRALEWLLLLWLFYRSVPAVTQKRTRYVALGVAWSYLMDLPALFAAFSLPGGFWVC